MQRKGGRGKPTPLQLIIQGILPPGHTSVQEQEKLIWGMLSKRGWKAGTKRFDKGGHNQIQKKRAGENRVASEGLGKGEPKMFSPAISEGGEVNTTQQKCAKADRNESAPGTKAKA